MPKSLKQASKKAIYESKVQQLDSLGTDVGEFIQSEGMTVVEQILGQFIERVHENINREKNFVTTGSINDITLEAGNGVVNVLAHPHLIYQDRGVNGAVSALYDTPHRYTDKMPPVDVIKQWIKDKKLFLTDKNDYHRKFDDRLSPTEKAKERPFKELTEDEKINNAAWGIATKIYQQGMKPRKIYSKEIPRLVEDLQQELGDFVVQQINQAIDINPKAGGGNRIIIKA